MSPRGNEHPTLAYLLEDHPQVAMPEGFDGRICVRVATEGAARYYILTNEDFRGLPLLQSYLPDHHTEVVARDTRGEPWASRIRAPAGGTVAFPEMVPQPVPFGDGIGLLGYWLSLPELAAGDRLYVRLFWEVSAPPVHDYTAFVHLIWMDAGGASTQVAGSDAPPGNGSCPTGGWLPGEVVVDELQFVLPEDFPDPHRPSHAVYYLEVGLYTPADGRRLDVPANAEDRVLIGPLQVAGEP
jgi:hypothetical protein